MNFIQGEKFATLADNKKIFYRHTHEANTFLQHEQPNHPFVLITHNSDGKVTDQPGADDADVRLIGPNMVKWFAQNVDTDHPKLQSIPIGLGNNQWYKDIEKTILDKKQAPQEYSLRNLLYVNHNVATNPSQRKEPYDLFKQAPFATVENGHFGVDFQHYIDQVYNHTFIICPQGHGIDTHRLWECLYLGSIPVVKRDRNNKFYTDLPILFVDEWSDITEAHLLERARTITAFQYWRWEMVDFNYWKNIINNHIS